MRASIVFLSVFLPVLGACSNLGSAASDAVMAVWNSRTPSSFEQFPLKPDLTYLEVAFQGSGALLVLAYVDAPHNSSGRAVETWASGSGEVLRTQSGFFVGSTGVKQLPNESRLEWHASKPVQLCFGLNGAGINNLPMVVQAAPLPAALLDKPSPLLKRAQTIPNLQLRAWQATAETGSARTEGYRQVSQLVASHPVTGNLVYGQYCIGGFAQGQCIEYLLRTAAQNL